MKIKLLHITSSLKMGGAEHVLCDLIKNMNPSIFDHHIIYFHDGPHKKCYQEMAIPTYQVKEFLSLYDPIFLVRLYYLIKKIKPDCIHTQLWAANNLGRIIGSILSIPIVSVLHNYLEIDGKLKNFIDSRTVKLSHKIVAISEGIANSLMRRNKTMLASQINVITSGVDMQTLHQKAEKEQRTRDEFGLSSEHFVIGSVGRFVPVKRFDILLEAFAQLYVQHNHARLFLVGIGPLEHILRQKAKQLEIHHAVIFVIGQPSYRYYSLFDCFALASDREGFGIVLLEAMSFGLPCVATNIEEKHPIIDDEINGLLIPARNVSALTHAYMRLIKDPTLRKKLGTAAQETVAEKFTTEKMCVAYENIFKNIVR